jgi:hypothetical protein
MFALPTNAPEDFMTNSWENLAYRAQPFARPARSRMVGVLLIGASAVVGLPACSNTSGAPGSAGSTSTGSGAGSGSASGGSGTSAGGSGSVSAGGSGAGASTGSVGSGAAGSAAGGATGSTGSGSGSSGSASGNDGGVEAAAEGGAPCSTDLGYAMQFQSQKPDLLQATIANMPTGTASRTIELWAYFDGTGNSWLNEHGLFETGDKNAGAAGGCHEFALNSTALTGTLAMLHPYGNCNVVDNFFNVPAMDLTNDAGWIHISFGYDMTGNTFLFTINGDGTLAIGTGGGAAGRTHPETNWPGGQGWTTTSYTPADATNYGANNPGGNLLSIGTTPQFAGPTGWGGKIDEFRVWSVFLTAAQIKANMYTLMKGTETGLVAYYKFDEGSGMTVADSTGTASNVAKMTPWNNANPPLTPPTWVKSDIPGTFTCAP